MFSAAANLTAEPLSQVGPAVLRNGAVDRGFTNGTIPFTSGVPIATPTLVR